MRKLLIALAVICAGILANAQEKRGPSTPEERERFMAIAHKLEANPLDKSLQPEREWALVWLIEIPDISVSLCSDALGSDFIKKKYKYAPQITLQLTFSIGTFVIEHPDKANDKTAQY